MTWVVAVAVVFVLVLLLVLVTVGRGVWRFFRGDVELEAGGSDGRQLFGRAKHETPEDFN